ncbi:ATP-dependent RNA helicase DDX50, putative [Entamoeba invadens IP1]|uniref:ATP-dependent RNA helicase DDX50, putative n=1 Tax=Entamoeba invadens IP1 TaxID=370355 RepID=UPI0002C3D833|nr:ATP-dependent RNA helicase DDX50, putative [Entamoeba invadens IP1]ELP90553.1 ATP-dependent RNA helicase DDX50, putative [Entamoeba invadens IP1]|eukprot:XP_004257324.1 ATP-dependent RNA helicase DDX50, putative [Entamoeba invadens IP1]
MKRQGKDTKKRSAKKQQDEEVEEQQTKEVQKEHSESSEETSEDEKKSKKSANKDFIKPTPKKKVASSDSESDDKKTPSKTSSKSPENFASPAIPESPMPDQNPGSFDNTEPPISLEAQAMLKERGITSLFPIQISTYAPIYEGLDVVGKAQTGSGKTISFTLPLLERMRATNPAREKLPRVIILSPTRELATQILEEVEKCSLGVYSLLCIYGGVEMFPQTSKLRSGVDIVVGTPGRVLDHINRGSLVLSNIETIILDEADQMLNIGFKEDLNKILEAIHGNVTDDSKSGKDGYKKTNLNANNKVIQTLLFSATVPDWVTEVSEKYLREDHVKIDVTSTTTQMPSNAKHYACMCFPYNKVETIVPLIKTYNPNGRTIVFCDTKKECGDICIKIGEHLSAQMIHGDINQTLRTQTIKGFKEDRFSVLIATDVVARGIDISGVDLIIMTRVPKDIPQYVHRAGRTARAGKEGITVTLYTMAEISALGMIEKSVNFKFERIGVPQPETLARFAVLGLSGDMKDVKKSLYNVHMDTAQQVLDEEKDPKIAVAKLITLLYKPSRGTDYSLLCGKSELLTVFFNTTKEIKSTNYVKTLVSTVVGVGCMDKIKEVIISEDHNIYFDAFPEIARKFVDMATDNDRSITECYLAQKLPEKLEIHNRFGSRDSYGSYGRQNDRQTRFGGYGSSNYGDKNNSYGDRNNGDRRSGFGGGRFGGDRNNGDRNNSYGDRNGDRRNSGYGDRNGQRGYGDRGNSRDGYRGKSNF